MDKDRITYISITDMTKDKKESIDNWLKNINTIEFLGMWENLYNPNFNNKEFTIIKTKIGLNNYELSVKKWCQKTNAIGLTIINNKIYAVESIAYYFASWFSVFYKFYLINEFKRLKIVESDKKENVFKINKSSLPKRLTNKQVSIIYESEDDVVNLALFGMTQEEWKIKNSDKVGNIRNYADIKELICLSNLETKNILYIKEKLKQKDRLIKLNEYAIKEMRILRNFP